MATIIFLVLFILMWAVLIVPRQRELKRHQALMTQLAEGDEVMLGSGVYGTITDLEDDLARLEVAPGVEIKVAKRAIAAKVEGFGELAAADEAQFDMTDDPVKRNDSTGR
ncbi:preprotein translocase subunit YajC [Rhabdothermincola sediminis]|uniref:preprotein translocase subunit YajC n=1 Tax=Rhabdothermincola sediminis TaxID=2751370 RepID=UPI001AA0AC91|nr:preprotein translocase subunit YajC [Rhabdothermincola sediminis]